MRVLITGHDGYIGTILAPMFVRAGHDVVGVDSLLFRECPFGDQTGLDIPEIRRDVRDLTVDDLAGFEAVVHLAAISNDPLGDLNPECTLDINYRATARVAELAKAAGVERFLYSSSCSLYGSQGDAPIDEHADFLPVTPYGESKVLSEKALMALADDSFSPTYFRNATAYGVSPRLRGDLVVNNLTGYAYTTGEVFMKSDGTPWRPLVHIEDISRAFLAALSAPRELVHDEAFNVGGTEENYRIRDVAEIVEDVVAGSHVRLADSAGPDLRNYRVNCDKLVSVLPDARPQWNVRRGVEELLAAFQANNLQLEDLEGSRFLRIAKVLELVEADRIDSSLRWVPTEGSASGVQGSPA